MTWTLIVTLYYAHPRSPHEQKYQSGGWSTKTLCEEAAVKLMEEHRDKSLMAYCTEHYSYKPFMMPVPR